MINSITTKIFYVFLLCFSTLMITSCGDDPIVDTPLNAELPTAVVTSYEGVLTYTGSDGNIVSVLDGEADIVESGSGYSIEFSDGVPTISGVNFANTDGEYTSVSVSGSVAGIVIDGDDLTVGVTTNGNVWAFDGSK